MPNRFCAICGKVLDELAPNYGMCFKCYLMEHPLFKLPEKLSIKICLDCGSYSKKNTWIEPENNELNFIIEDSIRRFILIPYFKKNNINFSIFFDQESFIYSSSGLLKSLISTVIGTLISDKKVTHEEKINININYELCKNCTNLINKYKFKLILYTTNQTRLYNLEIKI